MAGVLATVTAAGLALVRPAVLTERERTAALAIRDHRMRADMRFLASDLLEERAPETRGDRLLRGYLFSRFEAIGLEPVVGSSWGVMGLLRGRDAELAKEAVTYTAHYDHRNAGTSGEPAVRSAADDASGLAALLAIAEAFTAARERPRRSVLFAAVATEEQDLLDSLRQAKSSPVARLAAVIDVRGTSVGGRTPRVPVGGLGRTSLDDWVRVIAETQGRTIVPEARPDRKARCLGTEQTFGRAGVPAVCVGAETDGLGGPGDDLPSADRTTNGDLSGAVEDAQLLFLVGAKVADAPMAPSWRRLAESEGAVSAAGGRRR